MIKPVRSYLFLSDVHLGAFSKVKNLELEQQIIRLISFCEEHDLNIILLGDFFDYWMEYPGYIPDIGKQVMKRFYEHHRLTDSHTLYLTGNHDNWTTGYLERLGFDVEHEYRIIDNGEVTFMVLHGDGLNDPDMNLPRPATHRLLRKPYFTSMYQRLLPPRAGLACMKWFSGCKRIIEKKSSAQNQRKMLDSWAKHKVIDDDTIQAIVYGHHHSPFLWSQQGNVCMNCGYFGRDKTAGLYTNREFSIVTWNSDTYSLQSDSGNINE
ncbi:MAG: metallophosphoesterase [Balneolales bacterium]